MTREKFRKEDFDLQYGEWAVVCGASEGIGLEWAFALAERGLNVVLVSRNKDRLDLAMDSLSRAVPHLKYRAIACDLGDIDEWKRLSANLAKELKVGFVVYNAAYSPVGHFTSFPLLLHEQTVRLNVMSPVVTVATFAPYMLERRKGAIVIMSSVDGEGCSPQVANYAGTKAWATTFAESLWHELSESGVDVLGVIAGLTTTRSLDKVLDPSMRRMLATMESSPRDVVMESLRALGKGNPTVITGHGSRLITWIRWILPRSVECRLMSNMDQFFRHGIELRKAADENMESFYQKEMGGNCAKSEL